MTRKTSAVRLAQQAQTQDAKMRKAVTKALDGSPALSAATVDSFVNFAQKLGIGADNSFSGSTYGFNPISRNRILLEWIYRGSWIGGVAVDLVADDMTRAGIEFKTDIPPDQQDLIEEEAVVLDCWNKINEAIKWGRLYGGSIAVLLIDGQDPRTPLRIDTIMPGQFKGIAVFDRWMVQPTLEDLVTDFGPNLGLPAYYRVLPNAPCMRDKVIHHSRIILRQEGISLPYQQRLIENLWGLSVIERLYDRLVAFDSATTGTAQLVYKSYLRTLKVQGLREVVAQGGTALAGLTQYVQMMAKYQGIEGVTMIDAEDEYSSEHHGAFSGLADTLVQFGQQISGALQIPLVRLFGQSPAGLNATGESDIRTYYDHIKQQQVKTMLVGVTKLYKCLAAGKGIALPENFRISFKSLWEMSNTEKAEVAGKVTETVAKAKDAGLISDQTALKELRQSSDVTGVFTNITDEDIELADNQVSLPVVEDLTSFGGNPNEVGPNGDPQEIHPGPQGRIPVQPKSPDASQAGRPANQGAQPRRFLQQQSANRPGAPELRRDDQPVGNKRGPDDAGGRSQAGRERVDGAQPVPGKGNAERNPASPNRPSPARANGPAGAPNHKPAPGSRKPGA